MERGVRVRDILFSGSFDFLLFYAVFGSETAVIGLAGVNHATEADTPRTVHARGHQQQFAVFG